MADPAWWAGCPGAPHEEGEGRGSRTLGRRRPGRTGGSSLALVVVASLLVFTAGCSSPGSNGATPLNDIPDPVFNDPVVKIALPGDVASFSRTLYDQYVYQDTSLVDSSVSLEVYMTFFGGPNNRGRALAFLDNTNFHGRQAGRPQARAIWIMGNGDWQYAAYRLANESERWTGRWPTSGAPPRISRSTTRRATGPTAPPTAGRPRERARPATRQRAAGASSPSFRLSGSAEGARPRNFT